jgi:hypothetical protein
VIPAEPFTGSGRGDWPPEPSLLVMGISEAQAREIGAAFDQKAVVVGHCGEPVRRVWLEKQ